MSDTFRCSRGHEWQATATDTPRGGAAPCPICGGAAEPLTESDELPPPPGTQPAVDLSAPFRPPIVEGYDVGEVVGRGGMAVVYKARQRSLNRPVALKVLLVGPYANPGEASRIRAEAEAIARLQHPNVVHVYEVGERDGRPYLLMEYVDGGTLADRLRQGPVEPAQAAAWAEAIARGIHAAHRRGIVHRDLKPANVLLTADGVPKISDFGIARRLDDPADRTRTGMVIGTPAYMAPEQSEGRSGVGPAADIWAVGVILYEMLTGRRPFDVESTPHLMRRSATWSPNRPSRVKPGVPAALDAICLKCLTMEPTGRYPSAEALADDLARCRSGAALAARRRPTWVIPAAVAAAVILAAIGVWRNTGGPSGVDSTAQNPGHNASPTTSPETAAGGGREAPAVGEPRWEVFRIADDDTFQQIAFPTRDTGYAASRVGIYRTDDGGRTWARRSGRAFGSVFVLAFTDMERGWLASDRLYQTVDGGLTWTAVELPGPDAPREVRALALAADGWGLVGGTAVSGELVLFRRRAGQWERIDPAAWDGPDRPRRNWFPGSLAVTGPKEGWAAVFGAAEAGVVLHTADGGATWETAFEADADLYHLAFTDDRRGWLAGSRGRLWATEDGGRQWRPVSTSEGGEPVTGVWLSRGGRFGLAPLADGRVLLTDDGRQWRSARVRLEGRTPSAAVVDAGRAYLLARDGRLARFTDPRVR